MKSIKKALLFSLILTLMLCMCSCGADKDSSSDSSSSIPTVTIEGLSCGNFELSSENLNDGVWDVEISNTKKGSNLSPQLSWEPVEGASCYYIYMVDTSAANWLHWRLENVTETSYELGAIDDTRKYKGPCPPSGSQHTYEIYVFALKEQPASELELNHDHQNQKFFTKILALDTLADGSSGNIISFGHLSGLYPKGK